MKKEIPIVKSGHSYIEKVMLKLKKTMPKLKKVMSHGRGRNGRDLADRRRFVKPKGGDGAIKQYVTASSKNVDSDTKVKLIINQMARGPTKEQPTRPAGTPRHKLEQANNLRERNCLEQTGT